MKKIVWLGAVLFCAVACENVGKADSGGDSLSKSQEVVRQDSVKQRGEQTLEAIREKVQAMDGSRDTMQPDSVSIVDTARSVNP